MPDSLTEALIGALVGALVGSVLGYLLSYELAHRTRREERQERRKRLMRALLHEIAASVPGSLPTDVTHRVQITSGVHLSTLEPLIDLVADESDEGLLIALAELRSLVGDFNDEIVSTNAIWTQGPDEQLQRDSMEYVASEFALVREAADRVVKLIEHRM